MTTDLSEINKLAKEAEDLIRESEQFYQEVKDTTFLLRVMRRFILTDFA